MNPDFDNFRYRITINGEIFKGTSLYSNSTNLCSNDTYISYYKDNLCNKKKHATGSEEIKQKIHADIEHRKITYAKQIIKQNGDCSTTVYYIPCSDCPLLKYNDCDVNNYYFNSSAIGKVSLAKKYLEDKGISYESESDK